MIIMSDVVCVFYVVTGVSSSAGSLFDKKSGFDGNASLTTLFDAPTSEVAVSFIKTHVAIVYFCIHNVEKNFYH